MRVVLDTNVIYSGLWTPNGPPARVLALLEQGRFEIVLSSALESELTDVLTRPDFLSHLHWAREDAIAFILELVDASAFVDPQFSVHILADEPDNRLLEAAQTARADYIVSGDKPVQSLGRYEGIEIIPAARFLGILEALLGQQS